jgi:hypothetical protein
VQSTGIGTLDDRRVFLAQHPGCHTRTKRSAHLIHFDAIVRLLKRVEQPGPTVRERLHDDRSTGRARAARHRLRGVSRRNRSLERSGNHKNHKQRVGEGGVSVVGVGVGADDGTARAWIVPARWVPRQRHRHRQRHRRQYRRSLAASGLCFALSARMSLHAWGGKSELRVGNGVDPRDWTVRTLIDNTDAGSVHDLLVDLYGTPRYLDIALAAQAKHVLVPIGHARADTVRSLVWVPGFAAHQFELIPSYAHTLLTRGNEARILNAYSATMAGAMPRRGYRVFSERRTRRPAASDPRRLVPISQNPDLCIVSGEADPRGWSVIDRHGIVRGAVQDLIIDLAAMKVRYVVCGLAADDENETTRWVLIPVEFLRLEPGASVALLPTFSETLVAALPTYTSEPPDRATEAGILERFAEAQEAEDFYSHPRFDAIAFFEAA